MVTAFKTNVGKMTTLQFISFLRLSGDGVVPALFSQYRS